MLATTLEQILAVPNDKISSFFRGYFSQHYRRLGPVYRFEGRGPAKKGEDVVLVIGGIHPSEPSGSEIANWLRVMLEDSESQSQSLAQVPAETRALKGDAGRPPAKGSIGPYYTTIIIPAIFRAFYDLGRASHRLSTRPGDESNDYRDLEGSKQARQFPPPGHSAGWLLQRGSLTRGFWALEDHEALAPPQNWVRPLQRIFPEIALLMLLIDAVRPKRIASLHGKRLVRLARNAINAGVANETVLERMGASDNLPGVYVDPRYSFSLRDRRREPTRTIDPQKFSLAMEPHYPLVRGTKTTFSATNRKLGVQDDGLCLQLALAIRDGASKIPTAAAQRMAPRRSWSWATYTSLLVIGNLLHASVPTVHYADEGSDGAQGFSLGDWGPVDVTEDGAGEYSGGRRQGAPVYTFETLGYADSGAFRLGRNGFEQILNADGKPIDGASPSNNESSIRCLQLRAYAQALRWLFVEEYKDLAGKPEPPGIPLGNSVLV